MGAVLGVTRVMTLGVTLFFDYLTPFFERDSNDSESEIVCRGKWCWLISDFSLFFKFIFVYSVLALSAIHPFFHHVIPTPTNSCSLPRCV